MITSTKILAWLLALKAVGEMIAWWLAAIVLAMALFSFGIFGD